jgi:hypothetical protein
MTAFLKLTLDRPEDQRILVHLETEDLRLDFWVLAFPNNPVEELALAVAAASEGREGTVRWHLAPGCCVLALSSLQGEVELRIQEAEEYFTIPLRELAVVKGTPAQILLPLWRGLRQFQSFEPSPADWPPTEMPYLQGLKQSLE